MKSLVGAASGARFATEMTVRDGLNSAMDEEMERDPAVVCIYTPRNTAKLPIPIISAYLSPL